MDIQQHIAETEKHLWQELDCQKLHEEYKKAEEWILDLGHTVGRVSLYEKTMAVYWIMKNLVGWAASDRLNAKSGGDIQDQWRVSILVDIQRLNSKVDFLINRLSFQVPEAPSTMDGHKSSVVSSSKDRMPDISYILLLGFVMVM